MRLVRWLIEKNRLLAFLGIGFWMNGCWVRHTGDPMEGLLTMIVGLLLLIFWGMPDPYPDKKETPHDSGADRG